MINIPDDQVRNIVFIGGAGRSGTTLLRRILGQHEEVCEAPEYRFPVDPDGVIDFFVSVSEMWSPFLFDQRLSRLERVLRQSGAKIPLAGIYRRLIHWLGLNHSRRINFDMPYGAVNATKTFPSYAKLVDTLLSELTMFKYKAFYSGSKLLWTRSMQFGSQWRRVELSDILGRFYRALVDDALTASGKRYYVEKNTWSILYFNRLLEILPEARLVHIYRDPRDVVCSLVQQRWAPHDTMQAAVYLQNVLSRWRDIKENVPRNSYIEVSYEQLVKHPARVLQEISEFASLPIKLGRINLSAQSLGRWRNEISLELVEHVNVVLADAIHVYGFKEG